MIRVAPALAFASALLLAAASASPALAGFAGTDDKPTFLIPASDGYGVADCLARGDECAAQVANAWCAAQGYHHASGLSLAVGNDSRQHTGAVAVTCDG